MFQSFVAIVFVLAIAVGEQATSMIPKQVFILSMRPATASLASSHGIPITFELKNPNPTYVIYSNADSLFKALRFKVLDAQGREVKPRPFPLGNREVFPVRGMPGNASLQYDVNLQDFVLITRPGSYTVSARLKVAYRGWSGPDELKAGPVPLTVTP